LFLTGEAIKLGSSCSGPGIGTGVFLFCPKMNTRGEGLFKNEAAPALTGAGIPRGLTIETQCSGSPSRLKPRTPVLLVPGASDTV